MTNIEFSYADGTTLQQILAFEVAAKIWESQLADDVTVNIHTQVSDQIAPDVLGGALPGFTTEVEYAELETALVEDASSTDDASAVSHLPEENKGKISVYANTDKEVKPEKFNLTTANAKALGLISAHEEALDGFIGINDLSNVSGQDWNYDASRRSFLGPGQLDFLSIVLHEVGHVLGFTSGLDDPAWLEAIESSSVDKGKLKISDKKSNIGNPLDLFRYSDDGFTLGKGNGLDWSIGANNPYFSVDGGVTELAAFATGSDVDYENDGTIDAIGDGFQASHWVNNPSDPAGLMAAGNTYEQRGELSDLDLRALDVIGWDRELSLPAGFTTLKSEANSYASGGQVLSLKGGNDNETASATFNFNGAAGTYDVVLGYFDEIDGVSHYVVEQEGAVLDEFDASKFLWSSSANSHTFRNRTVAEDLQVNPGESFTISVTEDKDEFGRIDYLEFVSTDSAETIRVEAESMNTPVSRAAIRVEAEDIANLTNYGIESVSAASNGKVLSHFNDGDGVETVGTATFDFNGPSGLYSISIGLFDEDDGQSLYEVKQEGNILDRFVGGNDFGSSYANSKTATTRLLAATVNQGDTFTITGIENQAEYARIDYIDFLPVLRVEAENIRESNAFEFEKLNFASNAGAIKVADSEGGIPATGSANFTFFGPPGEYQVVVGYFDEKDGAATYEFARGTDIIDQWSADQNLGSSSANSYTATDRTVATNLQVNFGETFTINGINDQGESVRVDYIDFIPNSYFVPGLSVGSVFESFYGEAVAEVAAELGQSEQFVWQNLGNTFSSLTEDRTGDVVQLIDDSEVYGNFEGDDDCGFGCEEFDDLFSERAFFAENSGSAEIKPVDPLMTENTNSDTVENNSVNATTEPLSNGGYSGFGGFNPADFEHWGFADAAESVLDDSTKFAKAIDKLSDRLQELFGSSSGSFASQLGTVDLSNALSEIYGGGNDASQLMATDSASIIDALL